MGGLEAFLFGALGGIAAEFVAWLPCRKLPKAKWPAHFRRLVYWAAAPGWIVLGGVVAYLTVRSTPATTELMAFQLGATAPLFVERLAAAPTPSAGSTG
jgi:hypothetical protein